MTSKDNQHARTNNPGELVDIQAALGAPENMVQMCAAMNQNQRMLMQIHTMMSDMKRDQAKDRQEMLSHVGFLRRELAYANKKLSVFQTPPPPNADLPPNTDSVAVASYSEGTARRRLHAEVDPLGLKDDDDGSGGNKKARSEDPAELLITPQSAPEQAQAPEPHLVPHPRELGCGVEVPARASVAEVSNSNSNKGLHISMILPVLYRSDCFAVNVSNKIMILRHTTYEDHSLLSNTMQLVEVVMTKEERHAFMSRGTAPADLERFAKSIEKKCMQQMLVYEGTDTSIEAQTVLNGEMQGTYLAMGRRVQLYKNELKTLTGHTGPSIQPLQDRPPAPTAPKRAPARPGSIAAMILRRKNA
jgi:hypothetical protein